MEKTIDICPSCDGEMVLKQVDKTISFRGEKLNIQFETYVCKECNLHIGTIEQSAFVQNLIACKYLQKHPELQRINFAISNDEIISLD